MTKEKFVQRNLTRHQRMLVYAGMFAVIGLLLLAVTRATSPFVAVEPENATLTSNASVGSDASASGGRYAQFGEETGAFPSLRDPYLWPFAATSIWNMPIHEDAQYQAANINTNVSILSGKAYRGLRPEQDIIIMAPDAPIQSIYKATETWGTVTTAEDRCNSATSEVLLTAPLPDWFKTSRLDTDGNQILRIGLRPNHGSGILMSDGRTTRQTQPFERCDGSGSATSTFFNSKYDADIYNDTGNLGGHGGSGLSVIGGVIKLGELVPDGAIHHAIKINLMGNENYCSKASVQAVGREQQYLWPAIRADWLANDPDVTAADGTKKMYQGTNPNLCPGSLLALPQDFNINSLNSEPARIIATALRDYGGYLVDGTGTEVYHFAVEWGVRNNSGDGDSVPQEFERTWGYPFETNNSRDGNWSGDVRTIIDSLNIITNNSSPTIGGGPNSDTTNRLAPMAPVFGTAGAGHSY